MDGSKFTISKRWWRGAGLIEDWQRLQPPPLINQQELKNPKPHKWVRFKVSQGR